MHCKPEQRFRRCLRWKHWRHQRRWRRPRRSTPAAPLVPYVSPLTHKGCVCTNFVLHEAAPSGAHAARLCLQWQCGGSKRQNSSSTAAARRQYGSSMSALVRRKPPVLVKSCSRWRYCSKNAQWSWWTSTRPLPVELFRTSERIWELAGTKIHAILEFYLKYPSCAIVTCSLKC